MKNRTLPGLPGTLLIQLTQGQWTIIDEEDWEKVSLHRWSAHLRCGKFYAATNLPKSIGGKRATLSLHSLLLPEADTVDHRDGDGLNNRRNNLRPASQREQTFNRSKTQGKPLTSAFKGVSFHKLTGRWQAAIGSAPTKEYLGLFDSEWEAALAYNAAAILRFGDFAKLNSK